jgi:acyl-CoA reductase-like NAD-dependent aldehyde dehydrogenase
VVLEQASRIEIHGEMTDAASPPTAFLVGRNPATGDSLGQVERTPPEAVRALVARARTAQTAWGETPWRTRRDLLQRWWRELARTADEWAAAIEAEIGKPRGEAMASDVVATLDALRWTVRHGGRILAGRRIGAGVQLWLTVKTARLGLRPFGVIGMIGTWNYPLLMNAPPIAQALAAGNAVVWKPSELAPLVGQRLQQSLERAGLPEALVTAAYGGPDVGAALVEAGIDKCVFTGGIAGGRAVLAGLARQGIPAVAEFSGYDPAIVLPDAPIATVPRALAWGAFVGTGQTCVAVKRVYVVGDAAPWAEALAEAARRLRVGDAARGPVDLGPMISEAARTRFHDFIQATTRSGAQVMTGGEPLPGPGWFYPPTVLKAETPEPEQALAGAFGPVVLVRGVATIDAAVRAANASEFGLAASVWGRDLDQARAVAQRLEAGMVSVNDAVTPCAHAAAPFGGIKASGFGRTRGDMGLLEFAQPQTIQVRGPGGFRPQLFPYSGLLGRLLAIYRWLYHPRR